MIKIYGSPESSAGRCYWTLEEVGANYERVPLNMQERQHKSPEYLKLNPNGKVPCLVDGDLTLWESMAINAYLVEKYKPELSGSSVAEKGLIWQWSLWSIIEAQRPLIDIFIQQRFVPEDKRNDQVIEKAHIAIKPINELIDRHLADRSYIVGNDFTLADINAGSVFFLNRVVGIDLSPYPNLTRWLNLLEARPARQKIFAGG